MDSNYNRFPFPSGNRPGEGFYVPSVPNFNTPDFEGSVQRVLADNVGQYVVMEFLIGSQNLVRKQGILYAVGTGYVVLYDDVVERYLVCDLYSIKFTQFYYPGRRPSKNYNSFGAEDGAAE